MGERLKRAPRGQVLLDDIKLEGGIVVRVHLDKETGIFHARYSEVFRGDHLTAHDGESWEGKDLEKIRKDVRAWAATQKALKWEPVIAAGSPQSYGITGHHELKMLGHVFLRMMRARKHKGDGYEWRHWAYSKPGQLSGAFVYDHDLEVYPPSSQASEPTAGNDGVEPVVIAYTPERWRALLQLKEMEAALRERLREILSGGEAAIVQMLAKVPTMGLLGLSKDVQ